MLISAKASVLLVSLTCTLASTALWAAPPTQTPAPLPMIGYEIKPISQTPSFVALGRLQAKQSVEIAATVTERVKSLHFNEGQYVKRNQLLIELDDQEERANLQEAKALSAEAQRQYQRVKEMENKGSVTVSMIDEKFRQFQTAQAQIEVIEARLADRQIVAPFDGQLGFSLLSVGAMAAPGAKIVTLDDTSQMYLDLYVSTQYLPQLKIGLDLTTEVGAYPNLTFKGKIIAISPQLEADLRLVQVRALIPNLQGLLKTNMSVKAKIQLNPITQIRIPNTALIMLGDHTYVYRMVADANNQYKALRTSVTLGETDATSSEITSGLNLGDLVVSQGVLKLKPNALVTLKSMENNQAQADLLSAKQPPNAPNTDAANAFKTKPN